MTHSRQQVRQPAGASGATPKARRLAATRRRHRSGACPAGSSILWRNGKCRLGLFLLPAFVAGGRPRPAHRAVRSARATSSSTSDGGPSGAHWLGTTAQGEDVFSQIVYGARTSLVVGVVAGALSTAIALAVGLTAGYLQGVVDEVLSFFINLGLVVPGAAADDHAGRLRAGARASAC